VSVLASVGAEPARAQQLLLVVDDLDRGRQLVGTYPDDHVLHVLLPPYPIRCGRRGGNCYYEQGKRGLKDRWTGERLSALSST
jgi:hypothetical protein